MPDIVVLRLFGLGDIVHVVPALRLLRNNFPCSKLGFVCWPSMGEIIPAELKIKLFYISPSDGLSGLLKTAAAIRREKFDLLFDFLGNPTTAYLSILSGIKRRYGFDYRIRRLAYTHCYHQNDSSMYLSELFVDFLNNFGIFGEPVYRPMRSEKALPELLDKKIKDCKRPLCVINPNATYDSKAWPEEYFASFIRLWHSYAGSRVLLTWGPGEQEKVQRLINMVGERYAFTHGALELKQFMTLLSKADLFLTADTGPMNLAWALDVPVVALFGPTSHTPVAPRGEKHLVLYNGDCLACHKTSCSHKSCMKSMTADWVLEKIKKKYRYV